VGSKLISDVCTVAHIRYQLTTGKSPPGYGEVSSLSDVSGMSLRLTCYGHVGDKVATSWRRSQQLATS